MKARALTGTLMTAALLGTGLAGAATAPAYAASAPSCVKTANFNTASEWTVQVRNNCSSTKKIKVIMRLGKDSPCVSLKKGEYYYWRNTGLGTWKSTNSC
ncbi:hypothetical protein [Streptomyces sp. NPDC005805]|uniref:hypothetical protein n=1 Tax=Streptomyces sp. NPDC005805 TaxID=3157068 RepID=UPI0033F9005F